MPPLHRAIVRVDAHAPDAGAVAQAVAVLRRGGLIGLPTETVYGLGARALDADAIARVFALKGRPAHHPLIAHVLGEDQARALSARWPERASRLVRAFWPGPLTVVVERAGHVPSAVAGGGQSIALRAPSHAVARAVIAALGEPVAAPSANRYQGLSPTTAAHVVSQLGDGVDLVLDAGECDSGIESTVVDVRGAAARVLRPGALAVAALRAVMPDLETAADRLTEAAPRPSPGMQARHYAPRAPLRLAGTFAHAMSAVAGLSSRGRRVGLIVYTGSGPLDDAAFARVLVRVLPSEPASYARVLYSTLHDLDEAGVEAIVVQAVPEDDAWWAVADRLRRASTPEVD